MIVKFYELKTLHRFFLFLVVYAGAQKAYNFIILLFYSRFSTYKGRWETLQDLWQPRDDTLSPLRNNN
jgi:hypothetical protein